MMRHARLLFLTAAFWAAFLMPADARTVPLCSRGSMDHGALVTILAEDHGETVIARAMSGSGRVIEITAAADGSWSAVATNQAGHSCVVDFGAGWQTIEALTGNET